MPASPLADEGAPRHDSGLAAERGHDGDLDEGPGAFADAVSGLEGDLDGPARRVDGGRDPGDVGREELALSPEEGRLPDLERCDMSLGDGDVGLEGVDVGEVEEGGPVVDARAGVGVAEEDLPGEGGLDLGSSQGQLGSGGPLAA